jgi:hypothetical protein
MMLVRTTLTIDDDIVRQARRKAAAENRPLRAVINDALRLGLMLDDRRAAPYRFRLPTVKGRLLPGADPTDRDKLFDLLDGR